jgi:NitT/TauT family transport system substrate-binding protein
MIILVACTSQVSPTPIPPDPPELEAVSLQFNWEVTVDFLGFYVALGKGFYADEGLDMTLRPIPEAPITMDVPEQIVTGDATYGAGSFDLLQKQSAGSPLIAVANIYKLGPGAFFARADLGISTPADFAGHSVVVKGAFWQDLLEALLLGSGLTLEDVELVEGGFDMTPFIEGEVDIWAGFLTDEVVRARQAGLELVTFPHYEYGISSNPVTLYTSNEYLENNPDQVERFVRASIRGWQWAIDNPEDAVDVLIELNPELAGSRDFHIAAFQAGIPLIIPPGSQLGAIDCQTWITNDTLSNLESKDELCTTAIFEQAIQGE